MKTKEITVLMVEPSKHPRVTTLKPIYPEYLSQMFTKPQKKAGLPKCRFHDLRHLCAVPDCGFRNDT